HRPSRGRGRRRRDLPHLATWHPGADSTVAIAHTSGNPRLSWCGTTPGSRGAESRSPQADTAQAMSEENVEIVKRANAALNAHDVDGLLRLLHPDYEFIDHMGAVAEESGSGIETIRRQIEGWIESFPDFRAETEEYIDADDRVVCVTHWRGTGAGSGLTYSQRAAEVYTLRNGLIVRAELGFSDKAAALEAAGLEE